MFKESSHKNTPTVVLVGEIYRIFERLEIDEVHCESPSGIGYMVCGIPDGSSYGPSREDFARRDAGRENFAQLAAVIRQRADFDEELERLVGVKMLELGDLDVPDFLTRPKEESIAFRKNYIGREREALAGRITRMKARMGEGQA